MPRTTSGKVARSASPSACRPMAVSGASTRPMGRRRKDASPVNLTCMSWPATTPSMSRLPVPELPKSSAADGARKPPTP